MNSHIGKQRDTRRRPRVVAEIGHHGALAELTLAHVIFKAEEFLRDSVRVVRQVSRVLHGNTANSQLSFLCLIRIAKINAQFSCYYYSSRLISEISVRVEK